MRKKVIKRQKRKKKQNVGKPSIKLNGRNKSKYQQSN